MAQRAARIVSDPDILDGEPRIEGHRIGVLQLYAEVEERGDDVETVAARYNLDVAAVYRALAYYHEHPTEMEKVRNQRESQIDTIADEGLTPGDIE